MLNSQNSPKNAITLQIRRTIIINFTLEGHKYGGHPYLEMPVTSRENQELFLFILHMYVNVTAETIRYTLS